jgi:biotin-(acetyl-CoA carboxylase) ligase
MEIRHDWLARAAGFGNAVSVDRGGDVLKGVARGLGEDGSLLVETNNGRQIAVASGDVRFAAIEAQRKNR